MPAFLSHTSFLSNTDSRKIMAIKSYFKPPQNIRVWDQTHVSNGEVDKNRKAIKIKREKEQILKTDMITC